MQHNLKRHAIALTTNIYTKVSFNYKNKKKEEKESTETETTQNTQNTKCDHSPDYRSAHESPNV